MFVRLAWFTLLLLIALVGAVEWHKSTRADAVAAPNGSNLALGKAYTLDPIPNYRTPSPVPTTVLTDGKLGSGAHWVNGASHGWARIAPATVEIDLAGLVQVNEVRVHVTRSESVDIFWPSEAHVLLSVDGKSFRTVLARGELVNTGEAGAKVEKGFFRIPVDGLRASRILVGVYGTPLVFLDEIEVFGIPAINEGLSQAEDTGKLGPKFARDQMRTALREARIAGLLSTLRSRLADTGRLPSALRDARPAPWLYRTAPDVPIPKAGPGTAEHTAGGCSAQRIWPWQSFRMETASLQPMPFEGDLSDRTGGTVLPTLVGQPAWMAWQISNRTKEALRLEIGEVQTRNDGDKAVMHVLGYLPTMSPAIVGDLLLPLPPVLEIPPGESTTLMLKVVPSSAGIRRIETNLICSGERMALRDELPVTEDTGAAPASHFTVWGYPIEATAAALACQPGFPREYGIDTDTIAPNALFDLTDPEVTRRLVEQLRASRGAARVLLYINIKTDHPVFRKGADKSALQSAVRRWLEQVRTAVVQSGFDGEVLLYPVDEFETRDIAWYRRAREALSIGPKPYRFFGTFNHANTLDLVKDVEVPSIAVMGSVGERSGLEKYEFYLGAQPAKELSPSRYYFASPIASALRGAPGFGIWALADSSGAGAHEQAWSDIGIGERDFGMVYFDAKQCPMPSLRLAAVGAGRTSERILRNCWAVDAPSVETRSTLRTIANVREGMEEDLGVGPLLGIAIAINRCLVSRNGPK